MFVSQKGKRKPAATRFRDASKRTYFLFPQKGCPANVHNIGRHLANLNVLGHKAFPVLDMQGIYDQYLRDRKEAVKDTGEVACPVEDCRWTWKRLRRHLNKGATKPERINEPLSELAFLN